MTQNYKPNFEIAGQKSYFTKMCLLTKENASRITLFRY